MKWKGFWKRKRNQRQNDEQDTPQVKSYYFYIAKKRVEQLLSDTAYDGRYESYSVAYEKKEKGNNDISVNTKGLPLGGKISDSYGREDVVHYNMQKNKNYVKKLEYLVNAPEYKSKFENFLDVQEKRVPFYFKYEGYFRISQPISKTTNETIVKIISTINESDYKVVVDCSIINFSEFIEGSKEKMQNIVHSGNRAFFNGEIELYVEGLFQRLNVMKEEKVIHACAIYLKLIGDETIL